jgi:hypothetical protein
MIRRIRTALDVRLSSSASLVTSAIKRSTSIRCPSPTNASGERYSLLGVPGKGRYDTKSQTNWSVFQAIKNFRRFVAEQSAARNAQREEHRFFAD